MDDPFSQHIGSFGAHDFSSQLHVQVLVVQHGKLSAEHPFAPQLHLKSGSRVGVVHGGVRVLDGSSVMIDIVMEMQGADLAGRSVITVPSPTVSVTANDLVGAVSVEPPITIVHPLGKG